MLIIFGHLDKTCSVPNIQIKKRKCIIFFFCPSLVMKSVLKNPNSCNLEQLLKHLENANE